MISPNELLNDIAESIAARPCKMERLARRDFLEGVELVSIFALVDMLERERALYYRGAKMYIYSVWARENLLVEPKKNN
jgi:hypothetical protein